MQLGNGRWETSVYNNRLQIKQIGLGVTDSVQDILKLELSYGTNTQNNGSLREQKITVPGIANPFVQTYTYDDLNRLQSATETNNGSQTWKQTFTIDRYGNRKFDAANTTTLGSCATNICNPNINTSDKRFSGGQGYSYDLNGNVTQDATTQRYSYDAENHQKEFFAIGNSGSVPNATYSYDGDGRRVKKISSTETTVFVYNASGNLVAEYSTALATTPQVSYLTTDHLGSPRMVTNENGTVKDRKDFSAFGEESVSAERSGNAEYTASDQSRKNYTGYERDSESGLEYAQARFYNSIHGRYTSVDPLTASADIKNPQTFNRYSYVVNSPYKYTDPLGLISSSTGACGQFCQNSDAGLETYSGHDDISDNFLPQQDKTPKKAGRKSSQKAANSKQTTTNKRTPPQPAKKDGPKPVSATVTPESVGPNAENVAPGVFKVGSMATFVVSVVGDDGKPFAGVVSEKVVSKVNGVATGTVTSSEIPLKNGTFVDFAAPPGIETWNRAPTEAEIASVSGPMEAAPTKLEQTATFTIRSSSTKATLTVVHQRVISNVDGAGNLRPVRDGTRFVLFPPTTTVTQNSP